MSDKPPSNLKPAMYAHRVHELQVIARSCGYAIAIHGSMSRDLDVIAVPWVKNARTPKHLVKILCERMGLTAASKSPTEKPHGRLSYTLLLRGGYGFVDLSITPRLETP